jgi:membrane protein involved in colicin uptake
MAVLKRNRFVKVLCMVGLLALAGASEARAQCGGGHRGYSTGGGGMYGQLMMQQYAMQQQYQMAVMQQMRQQQFQQLQQQQFQQQQQLQGQKGQKAAQKKNDQQENQLRQVQQPVQKAPEQPVLMAHFINGQIVFSYSQPGGSSGSTGK